jgi:hypothetical protein
MEESILGKPSGILPMSVSIVPDLAATGCAAFIDEQPSCQAVMVGGEPCVAWGFTISKLEEWIATLEQQLETASGPTWRSLHSLCCSLKAAHDQHLAEHAQVVTEAPSADDLMAYLAAYTAAVASEGV